MYVLDIFAIFVALFTVFLFLPRMCYKMLAAGSVRSGVSYIGIPVTLLGSTTFPASCGISHVVFVFGLSLYIIWFG